MLPLIHTCNVPSNDYGINIYMYTLLVNQQYYIKFLDNLALNYINSYWNHSNFFKFNYIWLYKKHMLPVLLTFLFLKSFWFSLVWNIIKHIKQLPNVYNQLIVEFRTFTSRNDSIWSYSLHIYTLFYITNTFAYSLRIDLSV